MIMACWHIYSYNAVNGDYDNDDSEGSSLKGVMMLMMMVKMIIMKMTMDIRL